MKERIIEFLRAENKSSAQFAEEIGVQPSGISHILSGRNNPSLDFVLKMLERYKFLSIEWLLFGRGTMYKDSGGMQSLFDQTLFDQKIEGTEKNDADQTEKKHLEQAMEKSLGPANKDKSYENGPAHERERSVYRIVWFFSDGSFSEFFPKI